MTLRVRIIYSVTMYHLVVSRVFIHINNYNNNTHVKNSIDNQKLLNQLNLFSWNIILRKVNLKAAIFSWYSVVYPLEIVLFCERRLLEKYRYLWLPVSVLTCGWGHISDHVPFGCKHVYIVIVTSICNDL